MSPAKAKRSRRRVQQTSILLIRAIVPDTSNPAPPHVISRGQVQPNRPGDHFKGENNWAKFKGKGKIQVSRLVRGKKSGAQWNQDWIEESRMNLVWMKWMLIDLPNAFEESSQGLEA